MRTIACRFLETERLTLRRFTAADEELLVELDSDLEVMRFLSGGAVTPIEVVRDEILPLYFDYYRRFDSYGFWAAIEKKSGDFLGWFELRPTEYTEPGEVELGISYAGPPGVKDMRPKACRPLFAKLLLS